MPETLGWSGRAAAGGCRPVDRHRRDNVILAGNGVTVAAAEAGITKIRVVEADGDTLIAVRRRGLTANRNARSPSSTTARRISDVAFRAAATDGQAGLSLRPFWTAEEEAILLAKRAKVGLTDPDAVPPERATGIRPRRPVRAWGTPPAMWRCTTPARCGAPVGRRRAAF